MKTISKILSVVLCLSLVIGLFVFGSSAATTGTYAIIDSVANLTAGTYKMAAYLTSSGNAGDQSAAPYHLATGSVTSGDLVTSSYAFANGTLTAAASDDACDVELIAVDGKANTYYIKIGSQYLYSSQSATNRKLALGSDPAEWVASNNSNGGITLSSNSVFLGTADAGSRFLRSYKTESTPIYGVVFFSNGTATPPASSEGTSTEATTEATTPSTEAPVPQLPPVTAPVAGTAYKFGMEQVANGHTVYVAGGVSNSRFLVTTTDKDAALDVTVEASGNGFKFAVTIDGAKQYITASLNSSNQGVLGYGAEGAVFTFNDTIKSWVVDLNGTSYYIGSYSNFDTMSLSKASYMTAENTGISQYPAGFYPSSSEPSQEPTPDASTEATTPSTEATTPAAPSTGMAVVDAPVAGTAYKFGMIQQNVSTSTVYYLAGGMEGYYMATTTDKAAAIDVYLEETTGGYYMYTMVDGVKTYINMVVSGTHVNGAYEATASTVYRYDETAKTLIAVVNDADYWFGTRNDKEYTTVGPCATSYNGFYCQFYAEASAPSPTGDNSVISLAVAAVVLSVLGGTALVMKKKEN